MTAIDDFLAQKKLAANSLSAYRYDLEQFREQVQGEIDPTKLILYQQFLKKLKPTVQRRKLSAVNQFLYFLYETGQLKTYHKLECKEPITLPRAKVLEKVDLTKVWLPTEHLVGQLIALLIYQLGLQPSELLELEAKDLNLDFKVLTVKKGQTKRVLPLPEPLLPYLVGLAQEGYLFGKGDKPYSRQWLFNQLRTFLNSLNLTEMTAQKLREQYIIEALNSGQPLSEVAKRLGLKSLASLNNYHLTEGN